MFKLGELSFLCKHGQQQKADNPHVNTAAHKLNLTHPISTILSVEITE